MAEITLKNRKIGDGHPVYIIAEMSANHAGSLDRAKEIVRKAKECGADCIKIQTYTPDTLTIDCHNSYFEVRNGTWEGENLYSLYGRAYTPWEWQPEIKEEADRVGIDFLSTPFDKTAVDFLEDLTRSDPLRSSIFLFSPIRPPRGNPSSSPPGWPLWKRSKKPLKRFIRQATGSLSC